MVAGHVAEGDSPRGPAPPLSARIAAAIALLGLVVAPVALLAFVVADFLVLVVAAICFAIGVPVAWAAITHRRFTWLLWTIAVVLLLLAVGLVVWAGNWLLWVLSLVVVAVAGTAAFRWELAPAVAERWAPAAPAERPALLMNPKSGGGKVERFGLVDEARRRGIDPIVLGPGDDLRALAEAAVAGGADVIGMAGGDGSQAIVASVAAAHGVAFVCIPAGTRNHLAQDLGVDRDDVVGALDAFAEAREARIDLGEVNGQVFVNNVSLGIYAEIVRQESYRDAKAETVSLMLPELLGPGAEPFDLRFEGPDGQPVGTVQMVLVSNGAYLLDRMGAIGMRPRLDTGQLGVVAVNVGGGSAAAFLALEAAGRVRSFRGWSQWVAPTLVIDSGAPVPAGVDGESMLLDAPLRFAIRPGAVRVRTAVSHPGMSPAARSLALGWDSFAGLWRIVRGRRSGLIR